MLLLRPAIHSYNSGAMTYHMRSYDAGQFVDCEIQLMSSSLSRKWVYSSSDFRFEDGPKCLTVTVLEFCCFRLICEVRS